MAKKESPVMLTKEEREMVLTSITAMRLYLNRARDVLDDQGLSLNYVKYRAVEDKWGALFCKFLHKPREPQR